MKKNRNNKLFVGTMAVMLTASLFMTGCASKKDLQNCQNENRELTNNYFRTQRKNSLLRSRVSLHLRPARTAEERLCCPAGKPRQESEQRQLQ